MPIQLSVLKHKYNELIALAAARNIANFKGYLNLDEFFLQAQRREDAEEDSLIKQRIDNKTYQDALVYVQKLLDDARGDILLNSGVNLEALFTDKARIKEGAKHVAALDKNRPSTKHYKKYFGWGLALTIFGSLMIAAVAVGIGLAFGPALPVLVGLIGVLKIIGGIVGGLSLFVIPFAVVATLPEASLAESLLFVIPVLGPLLGGAYLLRKAHTISKERQDLSLGLAQAFPALTKASSTNVPARELSQNQLTQTIDAKLERANAKRIAFEAAQNNTLDDATKAYVKSAVSYYQERVQYLTTLKDDKDINSTILLLNRLKDRLDKTEDLTERNAVESEITAYKEVLGRFNRESRRTDAAVEKQFLLGAKETAEQNPESAEFMKALPTVKSNDIHGRTRFFQFPHHLKYHQDHAIKVHTEKTQAVTPSNQ